MVAVEPRRGLDAARIGADVRLARRGAGELPAGEQAGHEALLLLRRAAHVQALRRALVTQQREREHWRQRLVEDAEHHVAQPAAAVVFWNPRARISEVADGAIQV